MEKFTLEGDSDTFHKLVRREAELMIARALLNGNAHKPLDVAAMIASQQQLTQLPPPPIAPSPQLLLPSAPFTPGAAPEYASTVMQQGTAIQAQTSIAPPPPPTAIAAPQRERWNLSKKQQKAIAICMGIVVALWVMDAIIPGLPGRLLSGMQSLYREDPALPALAPESEPPSDGSESADPSIADRIREALSEPAAPTQ